MLKSIKQPVTTYLKRGVRHIVSGSKAAFRIPLTASLTASPSLSYTFTRSTTGTYIDNNGVIQMAAINEPRFQDGGLLVEPSATNLLQYSESFVSTYWTKTNCTITPNNTIAPDGTLEADLVTVTGSYSNIPTNITVPSSEGVYILSTHIKNKDCTGPLQLMVTNSTSSVTYLVYDIDISDEWVRVYASFTKPEGVTVIRVRPVRLNNTSPSGSFWIWGSQLELGSTSTSYIPTAGAATTRTADVLTYNVSDVITQGQGSLYCEFTYYGSLAAYPHLFSLDCGLSSDRIYVYISSSTNSFVLSVFQGGVHNGLVSKIITVGESYKALVTLNSDSASLYVNGVKVGTVSGTLPTNLTTLHVGCHYGESQNLNGEIKNMRYFKEVFSESEAIRRTS